MESSSSTLPRRPPQRRRLQHSSSNAGAYNDVVLSRAGKMRFEPHEYVEMFGKAHSSPAHSSIPVLDLSELDERVGSDRRRSYNPDYSNIFGGGLDDDVAAPHDALVNNNVAAKKTKTLIPTDVHLPRQESGLQHSPGKAKRSSPNQSIDGIKQPMSFNKTNENNSEASNRKTHTAQQNPVSGFTYFGDATPLMQKTESERPASSLKHEVSRTWSFSAEINGKSNPSNNQSVLNDNKDLKHSTLPTFASKEKNTGENSPSFFDLEIDENSAAGISSAALRRAIEQAEQSIRIAKMIMERRKGEGGLQDVSKPWINGRLEVKDKKETTIDHDDRRACEVDGKSLNSEKPEMREVRENVEAGKKLRDTFTGVGKKLASMFSGTETSYVGKRVEMKTVEQNIEAAEACTEAISIAPGLVVPSAECKSPNLESQEADHNGNIISSWVGKKFASPFSWMETSYVGKRVEVEKVETAEASMEPINITSGLVVASAECRSANLEYPEADNNGNLISSANKFDEMEAGEEKLEQDATTHIRGPESIAEEIMLEGEKILGEEGNRKMRIFLEDEAMQKTDEVVDDNKQKGEKNFVEEPEEMVYGKHLAEKDVVVQEKMEKKSENGHRHEKNWEEQENGTSEKEAKEEINEEPEIFAEVGEVEEEVVNEVREPNIDEDELKLPEGEIQQNKIGQRYMDYDTSEYEAAEHILTEPNNFAQVQKSVDLCDAEEANDTLSAAEIIEEIQKNKCEFEEADREEDIDEAINSLSDDSDIEFSDNEMPEPDNNLRRSASEENFMRANLHNTFEGPFSDIKNEKIGFVDAYDEEKLIKNEESLETASAAEINMQSSPEVCSSVNKAAEFDPTNIRTVLEQTSADNNGSHSTSNPQNIEGFSVRESQEFADNGKDKTSNKENIKDIDLDEREFTEDQSESVASQFNSEPNEMEETERDVGKAQNMEENKENLNMKEKKEGSEQKFETNERIEAIRRGREREKDRIAVERAIREARERAFAEARERAMASDKASSMEAKLRAERAAVERATAEARKRALEKARSQKITMQPERVRFSASSRTNGGLKHSYSSSDLEKNSGASSESAERLKARLERHQRVAERVAQALAEKNMRDLLAQKEQAVRNRLAESLDADIKRWATGKEGNLRALLSTLQYILGPDSGWQPLPLTEIVTTAAVKKAYRKATLYVHPDKLQQRGASIRQKYICEKVFDLLKAAWNRFNSEER